MSLIDNHSYKDSVVMNKQTQQSSVRAGVLCISGNCCCFIWGGWSHWRSHDNSMRQRNCRGAGGDLRTLLFAKERVRKGRKQTLLAWGEETDGSRSLQTVPSLSKGEALQSGTRKRLRGPPRLLTCWWSTKAGCSSFGQNFRSLLERRTNEPPGPVAHRGQTLDKVKTSF